MENTNPPMPPPPPPTGNQNPNYQQQNPNYQQQNPNFQQQQGYQQNYQQMPPGGYQQQPFGTQMDHPKASTIQTLGIVGLILTFLLGIVGLILNIIALSMSGGVLSEIDNNPGRYSDVSRRKVKSGRTCAIIGLSIQAFVVVVLVLVLLANG